MTKSAFAAKHFHDEEAAREWFEAARWPDGPVCPNCGSPKHYATKKPGRYRCGEKACRKDFTVMTKSVMERSHAPLTNWAVAFHMAASSKKGFSAHQLHRELGCQYNTAWFLHHRVMEAMRRGGLEPPLGGEGKTVEADETYFGNIPEASRRKFKTTGRPFQKDRRGFGHKRAIIALVERGGDVRSFHVPAAHLADVTAIVRNNIARESRLHTDESKLYKKVGTEFAAHETVTQVPGNMAGATFIRTRLKATSRSSSAGCAASISTARRRTYIATWLSSINTRKMLDGERAALAVKSGSGKRLTYRQPH